MDLLEMQGAFGEGFKCIKVSRSRADGSWEIFVDGYRQGSVTFYEDRYVAHFNNRSLLSGDDLGILLDVLAQHEQIGSRDGMIF
jgi:hypothetical protein